MQSEWLGRRVPLTRRHPNLFHTPIRPNEWRAESNAPKKVLR